VLLVIILFTVVAVTGCYERQVDVPKTLSGLEESRVLAEGYLNHKRRDLVGDKTEGATIYSVRLDLDPVKHTLKGDEVLYYTNRTGEDLEEIVFRVYANCPIFQEECRDTIEFSRVVTGGEKAPFALEGSLLEVRLTQKLKAGNSVMVELSFESKVPLVGEENYGIYGHTTNAYNLAYPFPIVGLHDQGGWESDQVPEHGDTTAFDSAYYDVSIEVPEKYTVAATGMPVANRVSGDRHIYRFAGGPVRDFAIQASTDYDVASRKVGPVNVYSYYFRGFEERGAEALQYACDAIKQYSNHFGQYPYKRFNVCAASLFYAAGMELSGLIQVAQQSYCQEINNPELELPLDKDNPEEILTELVRNLSYWLSGDYMEFVIAHETAHQWWGLAVGNDAIEYPWLDEALTQYSSICYFRWVYGDDVAQQKMEAFLIARYARHRLEGGEDAVAASAAYDFEDGNQYYASIYYKAPLYYFKLEDMMGKEAFEKSLKEYYREYSFLNAKPGELTAIFHEDHRDPGAVKALYDRWLKETHGTQDVAPVLIAPR